MKKFDLIRSIILLGAIIWAVCLSSCSTDADEQLISEEQQLSQTEFEAVMNTEVWTGSADIALAELYQNGGSATGKIAGDDCYEATYTETGFTATFNNCVLNGTDNMNGTLVVTYAIDTESASYSATFDGFYVGDVELNGTRTYSISSGEGNTVLMSVTSDMSLTMADGSEISENGMRTLSLNFGGESSETASFDITGEWTVLKDGHTYSVNVTNALNGNFTCAYLVSGSMILAKNGLSISIDLGDGTCDDKAMMTYPNGAQEEINL